MKIIWPLCPPDYGFSKLHFSLRLFEEFRKINDKSIFVWLIHIICRVILLLFNVEMNSCTDVKRSVKSNGKCKFFKIDRIFHRFSSSSGFLIVFTYISTWSFVRSVL